MKKIFITAILICNVSQMFAQYNSVLSQGDWYQISTKQKGIYKLDISDLQELGVSVNNLHIDDIRIYGNGGGMLPHLNSDFRYEDLIENPVKIHDDNNNGFFESEDYIIFYGESPHTWDFDTASALFYHTTHLYSDEVNYYLTINFNEKGKRISLKPVFSNPTIIISDFIDYAFHEYESENLLKSGREWFGERFDYQNSQNFSFNFPNLKIGPSSVIKTSVAARSLVPSTFSISVNNNKIKDIIVPNIVSAYGTDYAHMNDKQVTYSSNSSNIDVNIEYFSTDNGSISWLNYIEINAHRELKISGNSMLFNNSTANSHGIALFELETNSDFQIWDVTSLQDIKELKTNFSGSILSFTDSINTLHEYIAFNTEAFLSPILKGNIQNQNLHAISSDVEYIIVCHPDFLNAANRLLELHQNEDNLNTVIVTPEQIYHEFSSGMQDVTAIRDFVRMLYERTDSKLKYLLLFGDGSYDPKDRISNNTNYIPTYQSLNSTHPIRTHVTDDYFALLDSTEGLFLNDLIDIGVGRLPASTLAEANILVDKIERYYSEESFGSWRNDIAFVADDGDALDANTHMWQADSLANHIDDNHPDINIKKIYLDNYPQESTPGGPRSDAAQQAITDKINKGVFLLNYTGHGSPLGWAQERILEIDQIKSWENDMLPLFMTATCKFSYFDDPEKKSAGEYVLLNDKGGAIALLSTTRLVYSSPNYNLNTKFINLLFQKVNGSYLSLGDLFKETKRLSGISSNNRNFTLLGDPALRLAHPEFDIVTTSIQDTLKALSEVNIEGEISSNNAVLSTFNGTIYPTVYDKEFIRSTLGQESSTPMPYRDQNNILYKGAASVVNGKFSFSFIVPKDISYNFGEGKISYYAYDENQKVDARGSNKDFIIGGVADNIIYDYDGPEVRLYMNNREFLDGGITNSSPILIVDVFDLSGINMSGNGIGHDIVAILDDNNQYPYVLNDYYVSEKDDYTKGSISFPFTNLEKGNHTLSFKIWDVFNNSTEVTINFLVVDENTFVISDYVCFPNPFTVSTDFYFEHNKPNQSLDVILDIYSINGSLVRRIENNYFDDGYRIGPINWNGKDNNGYYVNGGIYLAKIQISSSDGDFTSKTNRVILLPK